MVKMEQMVLMEQMGCPGLNNILIQQTLNKIVVLNLMEQKLHSAQNIMQDTIIISLIKLLKIMMMLMHGVLQLRVKMNGFNFLFNFLLFG